jgi:hypothetical protein
MVIRYEKVRVITPGITVNMSVKMRRYWLLPFDCVRWKGRWYKLDRNKDGYKIDTSKPLDCDPIARDKDQLAEVSTSAKELLDASFNAFFHHDKE